MKASPTSMSMMERSGVRCLGRGTGLASTSWTRYALAGVSYGGCGCVASDAARQAASIFSRGWLS